ncbi:methyl-accepting chemotaxis protein [uncultured Propionivibrio sp.]|uniref:methyl-accepting chemotaxis protein n=1 Tax=uncultured Propionivibrio sp. TaxID=426737 RepID=UPI0029C074EB|nr:methyl-accepting chemotaxis protein [uncultured Propionivibrio sp.]
MRALNIGQRLMIMTATAIGAIVLMAVSEKFVTSSLRSSLTYVYANTVPSIESIDAINQGVLNLRVRVLSHIAQKDLDKKLAAEEQIREIKDQILKEISHYGKELASDNKDRDFLDREKQALEAYLASVSEPLKHSRDGDYAHVWQNLSQSSAAMESLAAAVSEHKRYNKQMADDFIRTAEASDERGTTISMMLVVIALVIVGTLSYVVTREIRSRMTRLAELMRNVAETLDFTARVKITRMDELGMSGDAFNQLLDRMQTNLRDIAGHAKSVFTAAEELATNSTQVATASSQQAESASNMAATVEQMTVSVNHVADRALETSSLANESGRLSGEGEIVINDATEEIQNIANTVTEASALIRELEESSQQISNVVQVIKEVAEQTNLLALNAAIEAARAGEQGRGFAVVADEVRKLAERTSVSTQEIATTITAMRNSASNAVSSMTEIVAKVHVGVGKAQTANASIKQIGERARGSVGMVEEIAEAIREQGAATNNIATQVERIAQMSEECSAAAANSAESARSLDELAAKMLRIVAEYKL